MRSLSARERFLVVVAVVALVASALVFGVVLPMAGRAAMRAGEEATLRETIEQAAEMYKAAPGIQDEVEELRRRAAQFVFPHGDVKVDMVHEIDELTSELSIPVTHVTPPGEPELVGGCLKYTAQFKADATFRQAVRLLYELESADHRLSVEGVEMTSGRGAGVELHIIIQLAAYVVAKGDEEEDVQV